MAKRTKKQCEHGIPEIAIRSAMATWDRLARDGKTFAATASGYVASLPKYPTPGTPEFYRCMPKWYAAFSQAQMMNSWVQQMATLQGQINQSHPILEALTGAYQDCMTGTPA